MAQDSYDKLWQQRRRGEMKVNEYPFVQELYRAMQEAVGEEPLSLEAALTAIEHED
jgi:hypothetical protein